MSKTKTTTKAPTVKKLVRMQMEKVTPGAVRYQEIDDTGKPLKKDSDGAVLAQLYIRKAGFGAEFPQVLTVVLEG